MATLNSTRNRRPFPVCRLQSGWGHYRMGAYVPTDDIVKPDRLAGAPDVMDAGSKRPATKIKSRKLESMLSANNPRSKRIQMSKNKSTDWQNVRQPLNDWTKPALIALIKDLYDVSPDNRDFLQARFQAESNAGMALEKYRSKIVEQFFPARGFGKLKLGEARKAIRDYRKATGNLTGTIDLMLTYVENGTAFTCDFGDINESFYYSLELVLNQMVTLLLGEGSELYPQFCERIRHLTTHADGIGWGYGDALRDQVYLLESELAAQ